MIKEKIYIVAGSIEQAYNYAEDKGLKKTDYKCLTDVNSLRGTQIKEITVIGTWGLNRDVRFLLSEAEKLNIKLLNDR